MELAAVIFLVACALAGFGVTYLSGLALTLEERIVFGVALGVVVVAVPGFLASLAVRDVTASTVGFGLVVGLALGAAGIATDRRQLVLDAAGARTRWLAAPRTPGHPWPLAAILVVCGAWTLHFFHQAYVFTPAGLYTGYVNIWGDWAAHLSFTGSFAYGHNFPPQFPIDPGNHLGYPFMLDYFAAELIPFGLPLTEAVTATSAMLALAFPGMLYLSAFRFAGWRLAAAIAVFVFLMSGGIGFVYLSGDLHSGGLAALQHLPREYTLNRDVDLQWLNPVLAYLVPQRTTLSGLCLALVVLVLIWLALREASGWRTFLFAGLITGVMPTFHVHAYGTVVALSAFWALFTRRREWLAFFVPAVAIGVPILAWMWPPANNSVCTGLPSVGGYCIALGWYTPGDLTHDGPFVATWNFIWFWIWNTSLLLPLMIAAYGVQRWFPAAFPKWFAPMWLWFLVPNVIVLQPWIWDNTKFFIFWALLGSVLVGGVLAGMLQRGPAPAIVAVVLMILLGLAGALDLTRASDYQTSNVQFTDEGGLKVAAWVRQNTSPYALFAVADEHNNP
ncbi:MAG TPA: hypothetical protein VEU76_10810, partial [Candidatus Udaeobacter sp.]|nr:hypothetical protein [Candidatus Udaeobacter sp.]